MSYATYTTEAIVCGTFNRNTADRSYLLFTREAGMLYAEAKSAREERSRQRFSLQDFSYVRASLIKGKSSWKIGSIEPKQNFYMGAADKAARGSVVTLVRFLRRFYKGQEAAPLVFDYVLAALTKLINATDTRQTLEQVVLARLLLDLGYVDARLLPEAVSKNLTSLEASELNEELAVRLKPIIDQAVSLSHL